MDCIILGVLIFIAIQLYGGVALLANLVELLIRERQ